MRMRASRWPVWDWGRFGRLRWPAKTLREMLQRQGISDARAAEQAKFAYGIVETTGGGLGLLSFGPLSAALAGGGPLSRFSCWRL